MAEGLLSGILGEEDEKAEVETPDAMAGAESFASAVAAKLAGNDPEVARRTSDFLIDQSQLLRVQKRHLEEEHEARLHFLRGQAREVDIRRFGLRLRVGFQLFLVLVATVIGIGLTILLHDVITSRRVIIEAFDTPPTLAARGFTGTVVAAGVLDEITRLQNATHTSFAAKRDLANAWSKEAKIEVPESGFSLVEVAKLLRARFGDDLHIGGDLVETAAGTLELTVRGTKVPAKTFSGASGDLSKLQVNAAEYVFAESQPCPATTRSASPSQEPGLPAWRPRIGHSF